MSEESMKFYFTGGSSLDGPHVFENKEDRWKIYEGQYFDMLDPDVHVIPAFKIPRTLPKHYSIDDAMHRARRYQLLTRFRLSVRQGAMGQGWRGSAGVQDAGWEDVCNREKVRWKSKGQSGSSTS